MSEATQTIARGEEVLEHAKELARSIDERVRHVIDRNDQSNNN